MALIVEDGSGAADADSLVTLAEVRAFALARGVTVSNDDAVLEPTVRVAHDYLLAVEGRLAGSRAVAGQALPFPRKGVWLFGDALPEDEIPRQIKQAVFQCLVEGQSQDLLPSTDGKIILAEAVGPISTTYANTGAAGQTPTLPRVEALLAPFFASKGATLTTYRG